MRREIYTMAAALLGCLAEPLVAQEVTGTVVDAQRQPLPYVNAVLLQLPDSAYIVGGVTDAEGRFALPDRKKGRGRVLRLSYIGYETLVTEVTRADMDTLVLRADEHLVGEVMVMAQKPIVRQEADRISYDVQADEESKTNTVMEMLRKVPFVTVDADNNIRIKGSSNFRVFRNGRPSQSLTNNPKETLRAMPATMIRRIEVITDPGAKYDAEGVAGILNLVVDTDHHQVGAVGNVQAGLQSNGQHYGSLWGTAQAGKLTLSATASVQRLSGKATENQVDVHYDYRHSGYRYDQHYTTHNPGGLQYATLSASYELDTLNLLTASGTLWRYSVDLSYESDEQMSDAVGSLLYGYHGSRLDGSYQNYLMGNGSLDYQHLTHRKGESLNWSYQVDLMGTHHHDDFLYSRLVNPPMSYTEVYNYGKNRFTEHTFQFDWTRPLAADHVLDVGAKYIVRGNHSVTDQDFHNGDAMHTDFEHLTSVGAAYAEYRYTHGRLGFIAGMRYEYSRLAAEYKDDSSLDFHRTLNDWVPSMTLSYKLDDANSVKLNYTTRINRPGIYYLNPAVSTTPTSVSSGNPDLGSVVRRKLNLSYMLMKPRLTVNASLFGSQSADEIMRWRYIDNENIIHSSYGNIGHFWEYGFSTYMQWRPLDKTSLVLNGTAVNQKYWNTSLGLVNRHWTCYFNTQLTQQFPWKLRLTLSAYRDHYGLSGLDEYYKPEYAWSAGLQRSFLKEDRLTVRLSYYSPIDSKYGGSESHVMNGDYTGWWQSRIKYRSASISVSYRFGSLNAQVKRANKSISNDDLVGKK